MAILSVKHGEKLAKFFDWLSVNLWNDSFSTENSSKYVIAFICVCEITKIKACLVPCQTSMMNLKILNTKKWCLMRKNIKFDKNDT